jgi:hypothetical protein
MDVHASTREIVRVGHPVHDAFDTSRAIVTMFLLAVAFALHRVRTIIRRWNAFWRDHSIRLLSLKPCSQASKHLRKDTFSSALSIHHSIIY